MHDNTAIDGWDDVRKPWNLGYLLTETKMIVFSTLFWWRSATNCCLAMELPQFLAGALLLAIVTLVILCEPDPKFSLGESSTSLRRKAARKSYV